MFKPELADSLVRQFLASLGAPTSALHQALAPLLKQFLQHCFNKMDLVTREEFDTQQQVLAKTRLKLEEITARLDNMK